MRAAEETRAIKGFDFGRETLFSHLLFANDLLLFAQAHISQAVKLKAIFAVYKACSGQIINFDKSNFFSKDAPESLRQGYLFFLSDPKREWQY